MRKIGLIIAFCIFAVWLPVYAELIPALRFQVTGVNKDILANVESRLAVERSEMEEALTEATAQAFARNAVAAVKAAVAPYGYYQPEVTSAVLRDAKGWIVRYHIYLGQPVHIKKVEINISGPGADNKKIIRTIQAFPLKEGDIFNSIVYAKARDKIFDVVNNEGFIKAVSGDSKVFVNMDTRSAVIKLAVKTNERYYFGKMTFNQSVYDPAFMQRFDVFDDDEPFSSNKLLQYQQDMNSSRYFQQVLVIPDLNGGHGVTVPMQASIVPVKYRRYDFGLGYGTFTGPRLTAGVHFRRLTDTGHSLEALLKLSSVLSGLGVKYYIPGHNPLTEQWIIGLSDQRFVPKNGSSHSMLLSGGYSRKMHHWTLAANMNYLWERYTVITKPSRKSQVLYPNLNLTYLKADNVVQPTYGRTLNLVLQGGSESVFSSMSFLQAEVKGKLFMTPFSFAHVILRGDVGYTLVNDLNDLPLSMRYFVGGMTSIRGFPDSSIGPGKYLGVASVEYRNHIAYDFSGAVFYDVGVATNHFGSPLNRGAGVGLVYESIVGPIKLYVARALSKRGQPYQIEFSMGPEF
jgi:translocation and assembly module TamA